MSEDERRAGAADLESGVGQNAGSMTPIELWHHQLTMAAARMATAVRTEDRATVAAVLAAELARRPPPGGVDVVTGLLLALCIQVPDEVPLRHRVAWSLDIDQPPPPAPPSSVGYAGSGGWGGSQRNTSQRSRSNQVA
jgi:hypothetical protein